MVYTVLVEYLGNSSTMKGQYKYEVMLKFLDLVEEQ